MKIARIASVPFFLNNHLRQQIIDCAKGGNELVLISSGGPEVSELKKIKGIRFIQVNIQRDISLFQDTISLFKIFFVLNKERFDVIHSTTPKAGFIAALAGLVARVPIRLHTFTGQAWAETLGIKRQIAKFCDRIIIRLNTCCYADSYSQLEFMVQELVAKRNQIKVLGDGSLAGVNLTRFSRKLKNLDTRSILDDLSIPPSHVVITFIGRITRDKGIRELILSIRSLKSRGAKCTLLLVGPEESDAQEIYKATRIFDIPNIHRVGYQSKPENLLIRTDILCIPSYREGFGNVVIEAAAMGVPTVGTDIPGLRDAVVNNKTGILVPPKDVDQLTKALEFLVNNRALRCEMGRNAYLRVCEKFDSNLVSDLVLREYSGMAELNHI
jgi:glycosyltransferase involved in cell wall biosynthesis